MIPAQEKKNPGINPGQPAGKGREKKTPGITPPPAEKKTLVLTLASQPEKGGGKKKTLVLTLGSPLDLDFKTWSCPSVEVLEPRTDS